MLKKGDLIAVVACSNAKDKNDKRIIDFNNTLTKLGLRTIISNFLYTDNKEENLAENKANELLCFYKNTDVKAIFDISGGDYANSILPYLDFEIIKRNYKPFFGYSDLTTIINALCKKTEHTNYLYQPLNIVNSTEHLNLFINTFLNNNSDIFEINCTSDFSGTITASVIGGNIRCFLKLAGTQYFPTTNGKILFLESLSGNYSRISTYFEQLKQIGCFEGVKAVLLGTFTELQEDYLPYEVIQLAQNYVPKNIPIIKTENIGHSSDSKCLAIDSILTISL